MEAMDIQAVESKLSDVTVTAIPMSGKSVHKELGHGGNSHATISTVPASSPSSIGKDKDNGMSKYAQLLAVIEEMGKEDVLHYVCRYAVSTPELVYLIGSTADAETSPLPLQLTDAFSYVGYFRSMATDVGFNPKKDMDFIIVNMSRVMEWVTKWRWHTGYSADSVEWCPVEPYHHVFVCGTYQLDQTDGEQAPKKQTRLGRIYLFTVDENTVELSPIQSIDTAGILDQKWCYHTIGTHPVLAVVTSIGTIEVYRLLDEEGKLNLKLWIEHSIGQDVLALSLDWSTNKTPSEEPRIVVSDSSGSVTVLRVAGDGLEPIGRWKTHGFEAWIGAFNYWNPDVFYSGGDDCLFKCYDARVADSAVSTNRSHDAGVTAVRSRLDVQHDLLTGSYDEKIRYWDTRSLKTCLSEVNVNGGVWRLKYHPTKRDLVVAACMYGGFRLVEKESVVCEYLEHESIAYGADWSPSGRWLGTCSFYDCKLHVSEVNFASHEPRTSIDDVLGNLSE